MPTAKPSVVLCAAISVDGKLAFAGGGPAVVGSRRDMYFLHQLRAEADVIIIGAETVRTGQYSSGISFADLKAHRQRLGKPARQHVAILSASLDLPVDVAPFARRWARITIFTTAEADPSRIAALGERATIVVAGEGGHVDAQRVVEHLAAQGARRLLLEGGGGVNSAFLASHLVDELYLTMTPHIIGGRTAPTLCDGAGLSPAEALALSLQGTHVEGEEVFLHYRVNSV